MAAKIGSPDGDKQRIDLKKVEFEEMTFRIVGPAPLVGHVPDVVLDGDALTVLFVEHDMDIVLRHASRVIAFASGRVIADGAPVDALASADVRRHVTGELVES